MEWPREDRAALELELREIQAELESARERIAVLKKSAARQTPVEIDPFADAVLESRDKSPGNTAASYRQTVKSSAQ